MSSTGLLNPWLYDALTRVFGHVLIANQGESFMASPAPTFNMRRFGMATQRHRLAIRQHGESYRVNCPYCGDTRFRLYFPYRWGEFDHYTRRRNLFLAYCYNEQCHSDKCWELFQMVQAVAGLAPKAPVPAVVTEATPPRPISLPADDTPLDKLPLSHPAVVYVRERRFDPQKLSRMWGIGYSKNAVKGSAHGRLLIPVHDRIDGETKLIGWQARAIVPNDSPKYLTAKGMKKSQALYGLPQIKDTGPIVITEGVTDVWRLGSNCVALFGKTASEAQLKLILKNFRGRELVVMLDSDAAAEAKELVTRLADARQQSILRPDSALVTMANLPAGKDPGDCRRTLLKSLVEGAVRSRLA